MPESNGADIEKLLIARDDPAANPSDYVLCFPESWKWRAASTSSTGIKWWSVVGESDETQRCTPGMTVNVWIGCTHPTQQQSPAKTSGVCGTGDALTPQTTYTWKVIALNTANNVPQRGTCDSQGYGAWSSVHTAQGRRRRTSRPAASAR